MFENGAGFVSVHDGQATSQSHEMKLLLMDEMQSLSFMDKVLDVFSTRRLLDKILHVFWTMSLGYALLHVFTVIQNIHRSTGNLDIMFLIFILGTLARMGD